MKTSTERYFYHLTIIVVTGAPCSWMDFSVECSFFSEKQMMSRQRSCFLWKSAANIRILIVLAQARSGCRKDPSCIETRAAFARSSTYLQLSKRHACQILVLCCTHVPDLPILYKLSRSRGATLHVLLVKCRHSSRNHGQGVHVLAFSAQISAVRDDSLDGGLTIAQGRGQLSTSHLPKGCGEHLVYRTVFTQVIRHGTSSLACRMHTSHRFPQ